MNETVFNPLAKKGLDLVRDLDTLDDRYVNITGDTMTGGLTLGGTLTLGGNIQGGTYSIYNVWDAEFKGNITVDGTVDGIDISTIPSTYVNVTGDTMTGDLQINANLGIGIAPTIPFQLYSAAGSGNLALYELGNSNGFLVGIKNSDGEWGFGMSSTEDFVIRSVTNSNAQPFRIQWEAPGDSFFIQTTGVVGLGTTSPAQNLHIYEASTGAVYQRFENQTDFWDIGFDSGEDFVIRNQNTNIFEILNVGTPIASCIYINPTRPRIGLGHNAPVGTVHVSGGNAADPKLIVQGVASQTANLTEWQDSTGAVKTLIASDGTPSSPGSGTNSEHWGASSVASGLDAIAIGNRAEATGIRNLAIGYYARATGAFSSFAVGRGTAVSGYNSLAIGINATIAVNESILFGVNATASGGGDTVVGTQAGSSGSSGVSIGRLASVTASEGIAIGRNATATATQAVTIGTFATNAYQGAIAIGNRATTTKANQLVFGSSTQEISEIIFPSGTPLIQLEDTQSFTIKGAASQTANLQEWQDSSGALLTTVLPNGNIGIGNDLSVTFNGADTYDGVLRIGDEEDSGSNRTASLQLVGYSSSNDLKHGEILFMDANFQRVSSSITGYRRTGNNSGGITIRTRKLGAVTESLRIDDVGVVYTYSGRIKNTTRVTTTYTILETDHMIFADTDGGAWTATLPAGAEGQEFRIVNCGSSGNDLTIDGDGAETVRGALTQTVSDSEIIILTYNATEGWW